jgi:hypothetical protein
LFGIRTKQNQLDAQRHVQCSVYTSIPWYCWAIIASRTIALKLSASFLDRFIALCTGHIPPLLSLYSMFYLSLDKELFLLVIQINQY